MTLVKEKFQPTSKQIIETGLELYLALALLHG
jgi:hypothetical protein